MLAESSRSQFGRLKLIIKEIEMASFAIRNSKNLVQALVDLKNAIRAESYESFRMRLGLYASEKSANKFRALGQIGFALEVLSPEELSAFMGNSAIVENKKLPETVKEMVEELNQLGQIIQSWKSMGTDRQNRNMAIAFTHFEDAILRLKEAL